MADSKFSNFTDGGALVATDVVVGLRGGVNTRFTYSGGNIINASGNLVFSGDSFSATFHFSGATTLNFPTTGTVATTSQIITNVNVSSDSTQMEVNKSYTINNANLATLTLPAVSAVGDVVMVTGNSANGWIIAQNAGNTLRVGSTSSTPGIGGSVASSNRFDYVAFRCVTTNAVWVCNGVVGSLTVI